MVLQVVIYEVRWHDVRCSM